MVPPDNKYNMYKNLVLDICSRYSNTYKINVIDQQLVFRAKWDISTTFDGFYIVSEKFKQFCENEKYKGLEFIILPQSSTFYWFKIHNVIEFNSEYRKTKFLNYSSECDGYESVIGANPACLKLNDPLTDGFFRTDLFFGSYAGKSPLYMVGEVTKQKLKAVGFKEIFFEKILDKYNW